MTCPHGRDHWQMCPHCLGINAAQLPVTERPGHAFTESEYSADPKGVVEYAAQHGRAYVLQPDGSLRVCISIPKADLPCPVCGK